MSNKLVVLWGLIVILLVSSILIIGKYYENKYEYIELDKEVKNYVKKYLKDENIKISNFEEIEVESETLKEKKYFEELKLNDSKCTFIAKVKNNIIINSIKIDYNCVNEIIE